MVTYPNTRRQPFSGLSSGLFDELCPAFGAGDGNASAAFRYTDLLLAARAGKIPVGFAQSKALLDLHKLCLYASTHLEIFLILRISFGNIAAEHTEICVNQKRQTDVIEDAHKKAQNQANQGCNTQKVAKGIIAISAGHKTLEPGSHK